MAQTYKVGRKDTTIKREENFLSVKYFNTEVVKVEGKVITLNTGGRKTDTTKLRMNQASHQFNLGYQVYVTKGDWRVSYMDYDVPFEEDTLVFQLY